MTPLARLLRQRIAATGPMTLGDYMQAALTHPEHGYYTTRDPLGAAGDFITAPEISQMFGELLGLWSAVTWRMMGAPAPVNLVEFGPGRGTLMADALRAARAAPEFLETIRVHLVETSPTLRQAQARALGDAGLAETPVWLGDASELPKGPMLGLANEFFDALPIRQFESTARGWCERLVDADPDSDDFRLSLSLPLAMPRLVPPELLDLPPGSVVEVSPQGEEIAFRVAEHLCRFGGALLIIDYGHAEIAPGETLQAVRDHEFHPALAAPGEADLTAHVSFGALARAAEEAGARAWGPVVQGEFLDRLGLAERAERLLERATPAQATDLVTAYRRLIDPDEMGTLFKVQALTPPDFPPPPGFE